MHRFIEHLLSPALGFILGVGDGHIQCIETERRALLNIKQDLIDDHGHLDSWGSEEEKRDCCEWRGIQCSNQTGHITVLDLHVAELGDRHKPLRGKINHSLLKLQHLRYLDLSYNDFQGTRLPNFNDSLRKLRYLNISNVGFTGTLSYQLRNLSSLQSLDLSYNNFSKVENLEWLSHLSYLETLDLSGNRLGEDGYWLHVVNRLPYLTNLHLSSCDLANIIPMSNSLANSSTSLAVLDLSSNYFSYPVFQWVFNLNSSLVDINLSDNHLEGFVPYAFQYMASLKNLNLSFNELKGTIPNFFGNFCSLHTLDLAGNNLTGQLPVFLEHLSGCAENSVEILSLEKNQLHGSLPDITRFSSLKELNVYQNNLDGYFPESFSQLSGLVVLDVAHNKLAGSLPDLTMFPSLKMLSISHNRLNGTITESLGGLSKLEILYANDNSFNGLITETHFWNLSQLQELFLNDNPLVLKFNSDWFPPFQLDVICLMSCNLGPDFPKWLQTQNDYISLDISDAGLSGSVPEWFWDLSPRVRFLNLSYNQLSGTVPDLSSKFVGSPGIDLSSNLFEGHLPLFPSNALSLSLSKNRFSGSISSVCNTIGRKFSFLDLSDNLLSGFIDDDCFTNGQQLIVLNLADNKFSGKIPTSVGSLSELQTFSLRNNSFSGEIPLSLRNCSRLRFLDLSYNRLSGKIPAWIGESQHNLVFFNLQSNEFHGSIPVQLCWLQNILLLDLSVNNISGTIPHCLENFTHMSRKQLDDNNNIYGYNFSASWGEGGGFQAKHFSATAFLDPCLFLVPGQIEGLALGDSGNQRQDQIPLVDNLEFDYCLPLRQSTRRPMNFKSISCISHHLQFP
ncbi:hypothetical protein GH714_028509 [Hevea brasiliensis]|uniref:Leucine-rich repeat-containing N-terminal plant-type domain-containing protein n=1 Tax=Hevea brasiliensis TaxID=3981 RepID=A0A6A6MJB4_HEVBR|nr:hypothetical protein GH714_028509 [Hevea brasiliensis]